MHGIGYMQHLTRQKIVKQAKAGIKMSAQLHNLVGVPAVLKESQLINGPKIMESMSNLMLSPLDMSLVIMWVAACI